MDKVKSSWWATHRPTTRRLVQLYSALLYNAHLRGFIDGEIYQGKAKYACVPGFNCYSCPGATGACPLGAIQNALASVGHTAAWYMLGIIMLYGLILGRTICGWLCPLGMIQELLHKIPTPKIPKNRLTRALSYLKYIILGVFAVAVPLWYGVAHGIPVPGFCKYICPAGTFEGAMGLLSNPVNSGKFSMLGILFTRKFVIMLIIGLACVFCYRSFCRFICPLGAIYGLFNKFCIVGVKVDQNRCNHCGACVRNCGMDVRHVGDHECINCAKCMSVCNQKAISFKAGGYTLIAPDGGCAGEAEDAGKKRRSLARILWIIALAVLCAALVWFNFLDPSVKKRIARQEAASSRKNAQVTEQAATPKPEAPAAAMPAATAAPEATAAPAAVSYESDAPIGYEVGNQLKDFTVKCLDGSTFHLAENRGKVTIINLWATYCGPCVQELPHFSEFYKAHKDDVAMIAVHSSITEMDPAEYIADKDWAMPIAVDSEDDEIWGIVNGSSTIPQTIVLNRKGEVIYNQTKGITPAELEALYAQAAGDAPAASSVSAEVPAVTAAPAAVSYESDAPIGYEVGNQLKDFTVKCLDGSTFHLAENRGKVTIINLWATYCGPCVQELPHFSEFYKAHKDDVAMIAVHSSITEMDPAEYIADKDWAMPIAVDSEDDEIWGIVNGSSTIPQTIVLNRKGEVIYNQTKGITPAELDALYAQAAGDVPVASSANAEPVSAASEAPAATVEPETAAEPAAVSYESNAPIGYEVGNQLQDFTVKCLDGSTFHLAENRGKVTIINLWATYCGPCVQELPHFSEFYKAHKDDVAMIAVHSSITEMDPAEYIADKDWAMPIAVDSEDDEIWGIVNGSSTIPQTIVLNRKGEVIYNQTKGITPAELDALYAQAAGDVPAASSANAEPVSAAAIMPAATAEPETTAAPEPTAAVSYESDAPIGYEVGNQLIVMWFQSQGHYLDS